MNKQPKEQPKEQPLHLRVWLTPDCHVELTVRGKITSLAIGRLIAFLRLAVELQEPESKYYKIIGRLSKEAIGVTSGDGIPDVLKDEPGATFEEITQGEYERWGNQ